MRRAEVASLVLGETGEEGGCWRTSPRLAFDPFLFSFHFSMSSCPPEQASDELLSRARRLFQVGEEQVGSIPSRLFYLAATCWPRLSPEEQGRALRMATVWLESRDPQVKDNLHENRDNVVALLRVAAEVRGEEVSALLVSLLMRPEPVQPAEELLSLLRRFPGNPGQAVPVFLHYYEHCLRHRRCPGAGTPYQAGERAAEGLASLLPQLGEQSERFFSLVRGRAASEWKDWETRAFEDAPLLYTLPTFARRMEERVGQGKTSPAVACRHLPAASVRRILRDAFSGRLRADWPRLLPVLATRQEDLLSRTQLADLCASPEAEVRLAAIQCVAQLQCHSRARSKRRRGRKGGGG